MNVSRQLRGSVFALGLVALGTCAVTGCAAEPAEDVDETEGALGRASSAYVGQAAFKFDHAMLDSDFIALDTAETPSISAGVHKPSTFSATGTAEWYVVGTVAATILAPAYHLAPLVKYVPGPTPGTGTFQTAVELMGNSSVPQERVNAYNSETNERKFYRIRKGAGAGALSETDWSTRLDGLVSKLSCASPSYPYHLLRISNESSDERKVFRWFVGYNSQATAMSPGYKWDGNSNTFAAYVLRSAGYSASNVPGNLWAPGFGLVSRASTNHQLQMDGTTGKISKKEQTTTSSNFDYLAYASAPDEYLQWNIFRDGLPRAGLGAPAPVQISPPMSCSSVLTSIVGGPSTIACAKSQLGAQLDPICGAH